MKKVSLMLLSLLIAGCSSTVVIDEKVSYKCGDKIISTAYFDDDTMMIITSGKQSILSKTASASGAKYENISDEIIFWNKGDNNYLEIEGQGYPSCLPIEK
jgi:membrane-bound inhibitor of C-type lysozyme